MVRLQYVEENHKAAKVVLSKEDIEAITKASKEAESGITGSPYPENLMSIMYVDTPALE